jgi:hypothetical protein
VGTYTVTVKATDNQGAIGTSSIQVVVTDASAYFTTSAACLTAGGTTSFTLATAQRTNATNYWWSYSGQGATFSYASGAAGYVATLAAASGITSGNVCVGVTYADKSYTQYCKAMNKCASAREEDFAVEQTTILSNNGSIGDVSLQSAKDINTLTVISVTGSVVFTERNIPAGTRVLFGSSVPSGLHVIQIGFTDGSTEVHKLNKLE